MENFGYDKGEWEGCSKSILHLNDEIYCSILFERNARNVFNVFNFVWLTVKTCHRVYCNCIEQLDRGKIKLFLVTITHVCRNFICWFRDYDLQRERVTFEGSYKHASCTCLYLLKCRIYQYSKSIDVNNDQIAKQIAALVFYSTLLEKHFWQHVRIVIQINSKKFL